MMRPAISVLLPVYNGEAYLREALDSVVGQTLRDWELVVVDDGSTDGSGAIVGEYQRRDGRVRVHSRGHEGLVATLNYGLAQTAARWVARMDADDVMRPGRLERQIGFARRNSELGLVACQVEYLGERAANEGMARWVDWSNGLLTAEQIRLNRFVESPLIHPAVMFRRDLVERLGGYRDGEFPEDYELWLRWLAAGVEMGKVAEPLLAWREGPGRLTRTDGRYSVEAFARVKAPYLAQWLAVNNPHHPRVVIWGAGRTTRQRLRWLVAEGVEVEAYVDIDADKIGQCIGGKRVLGPDELPSRGGAFVLSCVGSRGARELIGGRLRGAGYREGVDWLAVA